MSEADSSVPEPPDDGVDLDTALQRASLVIEDVRRAEERSRPGERDARGRWIGAQQRYATEVNTALQALLDLESRILHVEEPDERTRVARRYVDLAFDLVPAVTRLIPHWSERGTPGADPGRMAANVVRRGWDAALSVGDPPLLAHAYGRAVGSVDPSTATEAIDVLVAFAETLHHAGLDDQATLTADLAETIWRDRERPEAAQGSIERKRTLQSELAATWDSWDPEPDSLVSEVRTILDRRAHPE